MSKLFRTFALFFVSNHAVINLKITRTMKPFLLRRVAQEFARGNPKAVNYNRAMSNYIAGRHNRIWASIALCELLNAIHL